jgi:hypothetical protein
MRIVLNPKPDPIENEMVLRPDASLANRIALRRAKGLARSNGFPSSSSTAVLT